MKTPMEQIRMKYGDMESSALTCLLQEEFHKQHRQRLPEILRLAEKVEQVHAADLHAPQGLAEILRRLAGELDEHMRNEELVLFPAIRYRGMQHLAQAIAAMRADHEDHARNVEAILAVTSDLKLPVGACPSWTSLYEKLGSFISDLDQHIHIENEILFPRFERSIGATGCGCNCGGHG